MMHIEDDGAIYLSAEPCHFGMIRVPRVIDADAFRRVIEKFQAKERFKPIRFQKLNALV
ncbi:hypothetical protein BH10PLA2_BH10PLA2_08310 [soil metagenome]